MSSALLVLGVAVLSVVLTGAMRRYALARRLLDQPNERSSHQVATPRGGGVAIVIAFCVAMVWLWSVGDISSAAAIGLIGAGSWVALVGFLDDHGHIPARWRLLAHFLGAAWALCWIGGLPPLALFGFELQLGWIGHAAAAVLLVWLLNLYNFMDGIDAIAGIEAVTVASGGALLWSLATGSSAALAPALLAAASAGFLAWNLPPARIFMGDAGSGFLGLVLAVFAVWSAHDAGQLFWSWMILLGVFVVDATITLIRRILRGERFYEAHRSHAYQYAARRHGQHRVVSFAVGTINLVWLLPIAALVAFGKLDGLLGMLVAYAPLGWLAFRFKAGAKELQA
jgi:Fuc2NAc and GlcNAc transferase